MRLGNAAVAVEEEGKYKHGHVKVAKMKEGIAPGALAGNLNATKLRVTVRILNNANEYFVSMNFTRDYVYHTHIYIYLNFRGGPGFYLV